MCEDAITIVRSFSSYLPKDRNKTTYLSNPQKGDKAGQESWIVGGGAYKASDKVVQHNGCGTVNVSPHVPPIQPRQDYNLRLN